MAGPLPAKLPHDAPLFNVPAGLVRILDRNLKAGGIPKRDERGRAVDVHAMRHTFGTHLSKGGVSPRTAQAAMRHSSIDLTMSTYTDPRLLDVAGAMNVLPALPLGDGPHTERAKATGTDVRMLVPMLVPTAGNQSMDGTLADKTGRNTDALRIATSVGSGSGNERLSSGDEMTGLGLEPRTSGLKGRCSTD